MIVDLDIRKLTISILSIEANLLLHALNLPVEKLLSHLFLDFLLLSEMSWHRTLRNIPNGISLGSLWSVNKLVLFKELTQMLLCLLLGLWSKVLTFITIAFSSFRWRGLDLDNLGLSLRTLPSLILLLHLIDFIEGCCNRVCELLLRRRVPHQT